MLGISTNAGINKGQSASIHTTKAAAGRGIMAEKLSPRNRESKWVEKTEKRKTQTQTSDEEFDL
jgi:hypothetical protein